MQKARLAKPWRFAVYTAPRDEKMEVAEDG